MIYRIATIEELGFSNEDSVKLAEAKKIVTRKLPHRSYVYEVQVTWHDVAKLLEAGATQEQVLAILL